MKTGCWTKNARPVPLLLTRYELPSELFAEVEAQVQMEVGPAAGAVRPLPASAADPRYDSRDRAESAAAVVAAGGGILMKARPSWQQAGWELRGLTTRGRTPEAGIRCGTRMRSTLLSWPMDESKQSDSS